jgi:hypothetical protein
VSNRKRNGLYRIIMKTLLIILFFIPLSCFAPGSGTVFIAMPEPIIRVYSDTEKLQAIIYVETSGGLSRYNPGETQAVGLLQIWPIMVAECNRIAGYEKYQLSDRNIDRLSVSMFWDYQNYWNPDHNFEKMARFWVSGPDGMRESNSISYYKNALKYLMT